MDIEKFYYDAEQGNPVDKKELKEYINSFESVIIWGAGNLGTALGDFFQKNEIKLSYYWDIKYEEKKICNGVKVVQSFTGDFDKAKTLVIIGIVNGTLSHLWQTEQLRVNGYENYLLGMQLYEALVCPMVRGNKLEVKNCVQTSICNFNSCKKYMNILKNRDEDDCIAIQVLEIIVSRRCTLDCINCGQQVGVIKRKFPEKYVDYSLERIKKDIDIIMDNVDVVGTFSVIGGEPFIHPQIADIIEHCLSKNNVAIISITTNGVCNITEDTLARIKNDRVKINFSNYTGALGQKEKELFEKNVEKVKKAGIYCNNTTPIWNGITDELRDNPDFSDNRLNERRRICVMGPSVSNGTFYACPMTELYSKTERAKVMEDSVDLREPKDFRKEFKKLLSKPHYVACGYRCANSKEMPQVLPGEQNR